MIDPNGTDNLTSRDLSNWVPGLTLPPCSIR
jgi:hypothetical protein